MKYFEDTIRYGLTPTLRWGKDFPHSARFMFWFRMAQGTNNIFFYYLSRYMLSRYRDKYCLEIPRQVVIGYGLFLGHAYNITVNQDATLGMNCNIHKGVTIGQENRGSKKGSPTIGNDVWIGVNATVVGKVTIGDDVLIAPNCFVNCDVPSHSIVIGNPCIIKHKDWATESYISNKISM